MRAVVSRAGVGSVRRGRWWRVVASGSRRWGRNSRRLPSRALVGAGEDGLGEHRREQHVDRVGFGLLAVVASKATHEAQQN